MSEPSLPLTTEASLRHGREGFHHYEDGTFAGADGPVAVNLYRLHVIRSALAFEVKTGMKMTRASALAAANDVLGTNHRTKAKALAHLEAVMRDAGELPAE